ncbi:MAG: S4 domain-containing protein [Bacteroidetes bacterium]|nr:S4 domain-containing protein [Bacteroidota bacterium]
MEHGIRIDKWLWAVRIFKTRSLASEACRSGKVKILDQAVKPSRDVKPEDIIAVSLGVITKTVKVLVPIGHRVSAKLVPDAMTDLTPEAEYQKLKRSGDLNFEFRERGTGRPTKRERREIEFLKLYLDE